MSPRWPMLLLLAGAAGLAGLVESGRLDVAGGAADDPPVEASGSPSASGLSALPVVPEPGARSSTWYCASAVTAAGDVSGGTDGEDGDHTVVITNATAEPIAGVVTAITGDPGAPDTPVSRELRVPAGEQVTVGLVELVDASGQALDTTNGDVAPLAAVVELDGGGVAVEQEIIGPSGRSVGPCASRPASEWHFAWGATTRDALELLVLFNPFPGDIKVDAVFSTPGEIREPVRWQGLTVPSQHVVAIDVGEDVTRRSQVAASVRARDGRLVVERLQVFDGSIDAAGVTSTLGQPVPTEAWTFPHGGIDEDTTETLVVYNPTNATAEVDVQVVPVDDAARVPEPFRLVVRPGRSEVLDYADESRITPGTDHTTVVASTNGVPVVAERVLASSDQQQRAVSATRGSPVAAPTWTFPLGRGVHTVPTTEDEEGAEKASASVTSRYVVVNPDPTQPATVSLTMHHDGTITEPEGMQEIEVEPERRIELALPELSSSDEIAAARAAFVSVNADQPIVVERVVTIGGVDALAGPGIPVDSDLQVLTP